MQLECGRLGERLHWTTVGAARICRFDFSRAVVLRGTTDAATLVLGEPGLRTGGWVLRSDEVLSLAAAHRFDLYVPASTSVALLRGADVEELLGDAHSDTAELLHRSSDDAVASMWSCVSEADEAALRRSIEAVLVNKAAAVPPATIADGTRSRAVRGALEFIESHAHVSLRLADLCAATGVGARTMEYGFREFYDISPMTYVKYLRLNRARRDLVRAGPAAPSVKSYAEVWGFRHMGQFAKDYKILFGENPSATLVRNQDRI